MKKLILNIILLSLVSALNAQTVELWYFEILTADSSSDKSAASIINNHSEEISGNYKMSVELAEHFLNNENYDLFEKTLEIANKKGELLYFNSINQALKGNTDLSLKYLSGHLKNATRKLRGEIRSNNAFDKIRNSSKWKEFWQEKHYRERDINFESALNYFKNEEYQWALEETDKLINQYPSEDRYYFLKSKILFKTDRLDKAKNYIEKAIEINSRIEEYHSFAAKIYSDKNKYRKADESTSRALELNPYTKDHYPLKARILNKRGKFRKTEKIFSDIATVLDDNELKFCVAEAKHNLKKYTDAIIIMNELIKRDPSKNKYFNLRGDSFLKTGSYDNASSNYAMSLDIKPDQPDVYINYGISKYESGDKESACYLWKRALHYKHSKANQYLFRYCK